MSWHEAVVDSSMLIQCQSCATSYEVKPNSLGAAGRSVSRVRSRTCPPERPATVQRIALAHASQIAAATPAEASLAEGGSVDEVTLASAPYTRAPSADDPTRALDASVSDLGAQVLVPDMALWSTPAVDCLDPILLIDAPLIAPMDHNASMTAAGHPMLTAVRTALASRSMHAIGEKLPLRTALASPPADGCEMTLRFYSRRDAAGRSG